MTTPRGLRVFTALVETGDEVKEGPVSVAHRARGYSKGSGVTHFAQLPTYQRNNELHFAQTIIRGILHRTHGVKKKREFFLLRRCKEGR